MVKKFIPAFLLLIGTLGADAFQDNIDLLRKQAEVEEKVEERQREDKRLEEKRVENRVEEQREEDARIQRKIEDERWNRAHR